MGTSQYQSHSVRRHNVTPDEVEELRRNYYVAKPAPKKRLILLGETDAGRVLEIVLVSKSKGLFYPVTAYDASAGEVALYRRKKGGEKK